MKMTEAILNQLEKLMPPLIARTHPQFKTWTGVGGRRMANLDSLGQGPKERVLLGREIDCLPTGGASGMDCGAD